MLHDDAPQALDGQLFAYVNLHRLRVFDVSKLDPIPEDALDVGGEPI
jgi:hypothetical protein